MREHHERNCKCKATSKVCAQHNFPTLSKICKVTSAKRRKEHFKRASTCLIKFVGECCRAVLKEIIVLPEEKYPKLRNYKKDLLTLASQRNSLKSKREHLVNQGGGFLSFILPVLAAALSGLIK